MKLVKEFMFLTIVFMLTVSVPFLAVSVSEEIMLSSFDDSSVESSQYNSAIISQGSLAVQDTFIVIPESYQQELSNIVEFRGLRVYIANQSESFKDPLDLNFEDPLRLPSLYNESRLRIDAVIQNFMLNSSMAVLEYDVNILREYPNGTVASIQSYAHTFRDKEPFDILVPPGGSYTGSIEFDVVLPEYGAYIIQVKAQVTLPQYTLAEIHELTLPFNLTFSLVENPPPNPDILIYNIWFFALLLTSYLGLGVYGSWKKKKQSS